MPDKYNEVLFRQKNMPMGFLAVWLMVITTIQWMMLDMYLPALPILVREFGVTEGELNISPNAGIICAAIGTIVGGTLSDRFGLAFGALAIFGVIKVAVEKIVANRRR